VGDLGVGRMMMLKRILKKWGVRIWIGFIWLRKRPSGRFL